MKKLTNKQGFTLIEVVLVLAIGGLIFLLAFIAFQQVSANRRDTQRRADAGRFIAELQNYSSNTGKPVQVSSNQSFEAGTAGNTELHAFVNQYMGGSSFVSPTENPYWVLYNNTVNTAVGLQALEAWAPQLKGRIILYSSGVVCNGNDFTSSGSQSTAVMITLEKGVVCRDSGK